MSQIPLTTPEALSGIFGSISLASWIFLLVPQVAENYANGHADGISLTFIAIWFLGDITNFFGAMWAGLVPTVIALAVYFCFADLVLITQCLYYLGMKKKKRAAAAAATATGATAGDAGNGRPTQGEVAQEQTPLLGGSKNPSSPVQPRRRLTDVTEDNLGLPGSRRASSVTARQRRDIHGGSHREQEPTKTKRWVTNSASIFLVCAAGAAGWAVAWKSGAWRPTPLRPAPGADVATPIGAEVLGYFSAVCYLGARIPQIIKNQRERSCEGLSLLFFLLSLLGNATYGAGILFHSTEREYVLTNLPWLIGSLGTMAEDAIIFVQFHAFGETCETTTVD